MRQYASRLLQGDSLVNANFGLGNNWMCPSLPYLCNRPDGTVAIVFSPCESYWFACVDGLYMQLYGGLQTLLFAELTQLFTFCQCDGRQWTFDLAGTLQEIADPGDNATQFSYGTSGQISQTQTTVTNADGSQTIETYSFTQIGGGVNAGLIGIVVLKRQVGAGGQPAAVRRVLYSYYESGEVSGNAGDLKLVTVQIPQGTGWIDKDVSYYRYYLPGDGLGFTSGLKFAVGPEAYCRLACDPAIGDPLLATDAQISQFADNYFEYNSDHRVTKSVVSGGLMTYTFAYEYNTHGTYTVDYNHWHLKSTLTRPDGAQEITYTNHISAIMLHALVSGSDQWVDYYQFDTYTGYQVLHATPAAVASYDDSSDDLAVSLNATGRMDVTSYYTTTGGGAAAGYIQYESVQDGTGGSPIYLRSYQYEEQTVGGISIFPVSLVSVYPTGDNTTTYDTSYVYTFYSGTFQVQERATTLPLVATDQNGSGSSNIRRELFDPFGNRTAMQDERGYITTYAYDLTFGNMIQMVQDAPAPAGSGWTNPDGDPLLSLTTDNQFDDLGRVTQSLDPAHNVNGQAVRTAAWTVYRDDLDQVWNAQGYAVGNGSGAEYDFTLVNPVSIKQLDEAGRTTDSIQAVRCNVHAASCRVDQSGETPLPHVDAASRRVESPGRLSPEDCFPQSTWVRWSKNFYSNQSQLTASRVYFCIPACGLGVPGVNFNETTFGYDIMNRQNMLKMPGLTISRTVFDVRSLSLSAWVGTNDAFATDADPSGGGAAGNNMVILSGNVYDIGLAGGDGNLTQRTDYVDGTGLLDRISTFAYDFRDRQTTVTYPIDSYVVNTFDNLDRVVTVERFNQTGDIRISHSETAFDSLGRAYQTIVTAVDPSTGALGNSLTSNTWFDPAGNTAKSLPAGSQGFTKMQYDSVNRPVGRYTGYYTGEGSESYADALQITADNKIFEQTLTTYDDASNAIFTAAYQRWDANFTTDAGGPLNGPGGADPQARVSFLAMWQDGIGRGIAAANYGTNGNSATPPPRPDTPPPSSDLVLVSLTQYNDRGEAYLITDPAGKVMRTDSDDAGRPFRTTDNYLQPGPCPCCGAPGSCDCSPLPCGCGVPPHSSESCPQPGNDQNVILETAYNPDGLVLTLIAKNPITGDQKTRYQYGTTLADSAVARNDLLVAEIYADTSDPLDRVTYAYNRQSQRTTKQDQNGTVHAYSFDLLGRTLADAITTLGTGIDNAVLRIELAYEIRGMVNLVTSYDAPTSGSVVNQVQLTYNTFQQLEFDIQEHDGAVTGSSLRVQYVYADGSANTIRRTGFLPPSGPSYAVSYLFDTADDDALSRVTYVVQDVAGAVAGYTYVGLGSVVQVTNYSAGITYDLATGTAPNPYAGLDTFGRVIDCRWHTTGDTPVDLVRLIYGYDRASNRTFRQDVVADAAAAQFDELYGYDSMQRLKTFNRGTLDDTNDRLTSLAMRQDWHLDATGNWSGFQQFNQSDPTQALDQARTSNTANEIAGTANSVGPVWANPVYDRAGNMTSIPRPADMETAFGGVWDAWNRLVIVNVAEDTLQQNAYDGLGRRITQSTTPLAWETFTLAEWEAFTLSDWESFTLYTTTTLRHYYYSDQWQSLEERLGDDPDTAPMDRQFVWGLRYVDDLAVRIRQIDSSNTLLFAMRDANWSVVAICDSSATVQERYAYTAYGVPQFLAPDFTARSSSSFDWETLYCGYRYDVATGLYFVRWRELQPVLGCWLSRDPIFPQSSMNSYGYVRTNPTNSVDSSGLQIEEAVGVGCCAGCGLWIYGVADVAVPFCQRQKGDLSDCLVDQFKGAYLGMGWINRGLVAVECGACLEVAAQAAKAAALAACAKFPNACEALIAAVKTLLQWL